MKWYNLHLVPEKNTSKYLMPFADVSQYVAQYILCIICIHLLYNTDISINEVPFVFSNNWKTINYGIV